VAIPETQLRTWANQGATATAASTYEAVRRALLATTSPVRGRNVDVYLQGSYKNDTNIRGDSDVDVVVQLNDIYYSDLSKLQAAQRQAYEAQRSTASYTWAAFRGEVLSALRAYFGAGSVTERNKCITIAVSSARLSADVVVAAQYRRYTRFLSSTNEAHWKGITFWTQHENRQVVNWPKVHYQNGVHKNHGTRTSGRYKPNVRAFKNARSYLVDNVRLPASVAPSYFLECWLYNVDNACFRPTHAETFHDVLVWLATNDSSQFVCQNELVWLFGGTPEQWSRESADRTLAALIHLWDNW
jgi:Nucleotidyltransferase domain